MSRIKIKNFGPIKEGFKEVLPDGNVNEWMDIKKVTMFIGNQASGKSTVSKLISTFSWIEKALLNGTLERMDKTNFLEERCSYFRLQKYFRDDSEIHYQGEYCDIRYFNQNISVEYNKVSGLYVIPKIMYIPAERSFLSSVEDAENVSGLPKPLFEFMFENNRSLKELDSELPIPIGNYRLRYDSHKRVSYVLGQGYEIELAAASSGLHSAVPLYVVTRNLAETVYKGESDHSISELSYKQQQKKKAELRELTIDDVISNEHLDDFKKQEQIIESKYRNSSFLNIVEEPEQNLFPTSQKTVVFNLLEVNSMLPGNKLIMTTHSPYLINYLTLAVKAYQVSEELKSEMLREKLNAVVPLKSVVNPDDLVLYELNEKNGTITKLPDYYGIPSDKNYLNESLAESNLSYDTILEIQEDNES